MATTCPTCGPGSLSDDVSPSVTTRAIDIARAVARRAPAEFDMPTGALVSIDPHDRVFVQCVRGNLWVTQTGDDRDTLLTEGKSFTPRRKGRVVIQALSDARVRLF